MPSLTPPWGTEPTPVPPHPSPTQEVQMEIETPVPHHSPSPTQEVQIEIEIAEDDTEAEDGSGASTPSLPPQTPTYHGLFYFLWSRGNRLKLLSWFFSGMVDRLLSMLVGNDPRLILSLSILLFLFYLEDEFRRIRARKAVFRRFNFYYRRYADSPYEYPLMTPVDIFVFIFGLTQILFIIAAILLSNGGDEKTSVSISRGNTMSHVFLFAHGKNFGDHFEDILAPYMAQFRVPIP
ncbi:hypothetical protein V6N13_066955 [Hibiscus sabdariffa]|uniref:Uncharacterized protein n=1 Tax=Hibiscus sabdariffa TaxID=183260 RepID=A0ABR2DRZ3_9ROSI